MSMHRLARWIGAAAITWAAQGCVIRETAPVNPGYGYGSPGYAQLGASTPAALGQPEPYEVASMPPEPLYEQETDSPGDGNVWIDGSWHWNGAEWVWVSGRWEQQQDGYVYVQPYYDYTNTGYLYTPGYWARPGEVPRGWSVQTGRDGRPTRGIPPVRVGGYNPSPVRPGQGGGNVGGGRPVVGGGGTVRPGGTAGGYPISGGGGGGVYRPTTGATVRGSEAGPPERGTPPPVIESGARGGVYSPQRGTVYSPSHGQVYSPTGAPVGNERPTWSPHPVGGGGGPTYAAPVYSGEHGGGAGERPPMPTSPPPTYSGGGAGVSHAPSGGAPASHGPTATHRHP